MIYSHEVQTMCPVAQGVNHGPAPIPEEAKWVKAKEVKDISGLTHGVGCLLYTSASYGFEGNLWQNYLTFLLVNDENAYSTECEIVGEIAGSVNAAALHDFEIFRELFSYDFSVLEKALNVDCLSVLWQYESVSGHGKVFNKRIRDRICELSRKLAACESVETFKCTMTQFYNCLLYTSRCV